jgi:hypothetical protein
MASAIEEYLANETPEQEAERRRKIAKTQKADAAARRAKISIRESLVKQMSLNAPDDIAEKMIENGADPMDCTVHEAIAFSMVQKAMRGNVKAWEMVVKLMGEDVSKTEVTVKGTNLRDLIKERMESLDGTNSD